MYLLDLQVRRVLSDEKLDGSETPPLHAPGPGLRRAEPPLHAAEPVLHDAEPPLHAAEPVLHDAEPLMHETGYPQGKRALDEAKFRPRTADRTELFFTHALRSVQNGCNGPIAAAIDSNKTVTSPERAPAPTPSVSWLAGYVQIWMMVFRLRNVADALEEIKGGQEVLDTPLATNALAVARQPPIWDRRQVLPH